MGPSRVRIESISAEPLRVHLREPFVIATARVEVTPSVLVSVHLRDLGTGRAATGIGESATLPPVTEETPESVLATMRRSAHALAGRVVTLDAGFADLDVATRGPCSGCHVARAGLESALLDAVARLADVPLRTLIGGARGAATRTLETDMTIPIAEPAHMGELVRGWRQRGFRAFKVKVGRALDDDVRALEAIAQAAPGARVRLDANAGYDARTAIELARRAARLELVVECFEQPCGARDLDAMAEVTKAIEPPVIADESVTTLVELDAVRHARAADGVNLKLAKSGGPLETLAIGRAAQAMGMPLMMGGMVETRLGMTQAAHVAAALGGVEFADLDTAWLLADDPFEGGYRADGPHYTLPETPGLGVCPRSPGTFGG